MSILEGIFQGILQGLTEFLPVSSSGHLSIFQYFFDIEGGHSITVFLHLGTLFAVFAVFFRQFWNLVCEAGLIIRDLVTLKFSFKNFSPRRRMFFMLVLSCVPLLAILPVKDAISHFAEDGSILLEGFCFIFSGVMILIASRMAPAAGLGKTAATMKWTDALLIGVGQTIATLPGVSRSGTTISSSLILGLDREYAFEYSFILGTPAILAATGSEIADFFRGGTDSVASGDVLACVIGVIVAAVVGFFAIKLMAKLVKSNKFVYFGYYCLALGVVVLVAAAVGK